jgi:probable phosphoglycerate mutase
VVLGPQGVAPDESAGPATELTLVRHGRTGWHSDNRYAGASDVPLDEVGLRQAQQLASWAAQHPHDVVACSPLRRALQTATPVAAALGLRPEVIPALREMDFGVAEGRTLGELRELDPKAAAAFLADPTRNPFPGAELPDAVAHRVVGGLRTLVHRHQGASVLVIGHNTALRLALCGWLGIPLARYRDVLPRLENAAITRLRVSADPDRPPALLCLNLPTTTTAPTTTAPTTTAPTNSNSHSPDPAVSSPSMKMNRRTR